MEIDNPKNQHITGSLAYFLYWSIEFGCLISITFLRSQCINLEIILSEDDNLLAYRYDKPDGSKVLIVNEGQWDMHDPKFDFQRIRLN